MISVRHLSKTYKNPDGTSLTVLKDVNCDIYPGDVISIIGPSGSGKSTFLRALNLLDPPTGGSITFDGEDILAKGYPVHKMRRKMGMVFQSFNLFQHLSVLENITFAPCKLLGADPAQAREEALSLLARVGLEHKADAMPDNLSGGQKQRVAIARAMAMHPEIILFDEPTSALDPSMVGEVQSVIRSLAMEKMTMAIVTHSMKFAKEISTRIFFMNEGVIYEEGSPEKLFTNPDRSATKAFIQNIHKLLFLVEGSSFDFLGMTSSISQFCLKYNILDKARPAEQIAKEMIFTHLASYRPLTVRMTYSEISETTALDFMIEGMDTSPLSGLAPDALAGVRALSQGIIEEPTTRGFRVKVLI